MASSGARTVLQRMWFFWRRRSTFASRLSRLSFARCSRRVRGRRGGSGGWAYEDAGGAGGMTGGRPEGRGVPAEEAAWVWGWGGLTGGTVFSAPAGVSASAASGSAGGSAAFSGSPAGWSSDVSGADISSSCARSFPASSVFCCSSRAVSARMPSTSMLNSHSPEGLSSFFLLKMITSLLGRKTARFRQELRLLVLLYRIFPVLARVQRRHLQTDRKKSGKNA